MKAVSDKQRAKRLAAGERFIGSSIAPKPVQPQPSSGYCPIRRKTKVKKAKPIPKSNPERQAKVAKRQRVKHAGYMKSETRKTVDERAGEYCEAALTLDVDHGEPYTIARITPPDVTHPWFYRHIPFVSGRCANAPVHHHHRSYARYGGKELPEDMLKVCKRCHDALEAAKPAGNRFTRNRRGQ